MSAKEQDWLKVLHAVHKRHITQTEAAKKPGISARWVRVLLRWVQAGGDTTVVHRLRNPYLLARPGVDGHHRPAAVPG